MEPIKNGNGQGHETSDATLKAVILLVAMTLGFVVVGVVSMYFLYGFVIEYQTRNDTPRSPLEDTRAPFTGPRLQVAPPLDMDEMEASENEVLNSYDQNLRFGTLFLWAQWLLLPALFLALNYLYLGIQYVKK